MSQCVPSWDLEDINPNHGLEDTNYNHGVFKFDYEVAELTWENGQVTMHELGPRRVPGKPQPTTSWDKPRAVETLEAIVNQATHQPYYKPQVAVNEDELVPWLYHHTATAKPTAGSLNASATMASDALVPSSHNKIDKRSTQANRSIVSASDAGCSTRVGSCSGDPSACMNRRMVRGGDRGGGGTTAVAYDWSSYKDISVSVSDTFGTYDEDLGGQRLTSTSTEWPENTNSGRDCSKSTLPDDPVCHYRTQETNVIKEKKTGKAKSLVSKKRRTAAIHNQSERKRRDKINQKMNTLQKLVPNSSKTDKSSMLDEVIDYVKQLQTQVHMINKMNSSPMMMSLVMQQQQQMYMSMMNPMGINMGMGMGMGMGDMDMNSISLSNVQTGFHPSTFMNMPSWNNHTTDRATNPMTAFLASQSQPMNMDAYSRMAALYQHMQNQPCGPLPKN